MRKKKNHALLFQQIVVTIKIVFFITFDYYVKFNVKMIHAMVGNIMLIVLFLRNKIKFEYCITQIDWNNNFLCYSYQI